MGKRKKAFLTDCLVKKIRIKVTNQFIKFGVPKMPKVKEASILLNIKGGEFLNLLIQTANFQINFAVLINVGPLLFFL